MEKTEDTVGKIFRLNGCRLSEFFKAPSVCNGLCDASADLDYNTCKCIKIYESIYYHPDDSAYRQARAVADHSPCWSPDKGPARGDPAYQWEAQMPHQ